MASKAYELLDQIKDLALLSTTGQDTSLLRRMNLVQWNIYNVHYPWRALESKVNVTTTTSQAYVDFPSTVAQIYYLVQDTVSPYAELIYVPPQKFSKIIPQPTLYSTNKPTHYTWFANKLWFYPIPDAAYVLKAFSYLKPVNMKIYTTGTSQHSGTTVTGTTTKFSDNANVDTNMFYAYTADVRSDGTYPWSSISAVTTTTAMTISTYSGATGASATTYVASSASSYPEDFDSLLIYGALTMFAGKSRETEKLMAWAEDQYTKQLSGLIDSQGSKPAYKPILQDFILDAPLLGDDAHKFPFIRSDI